MINVLRHILSPKVTLHLIMRGRISGREGLTVQAIVQAFNLKGQMRIVPESFVQMSLEGPKSKLEALISQLQHSSIGRGNILIETSWGEYKKQYQHFRCSL